MVEASGSNPDLSISLFLGAAFFPMPKGFQERIRPREFQAPDQNKA
jgi:hypothetical protein